METQIWLYLDWTRRFLQKKNLWTKCWQNQQTQQWPFSNLQNGNQQIYRTHWLRIQNDLPQSKTSSQCRYLKQQWWICPYTSNSRYRLGCTRKSVSCSWSRKMWILLGFQCCRSLRVLASFQRNQQNSLSSTISRLLKKLRQLRMQWRF